MSSKHTPGPWRYRGGAVYAYKVRVMAGERIVDVEENESNLRLAAFAPQMFDLLKHFKDGETEPKGWEIDELVAEIEGEQ